MFYKAILQLKTDTYIFLHYSVKPTLKKVSKTENRFDKLKKKESTKASYLIFGHQSIFTVLCLTSVHHQVRLSHDNCETALIAEATLSLFQVDFRSNLKIVEKTAGIEEVRYFEILIIADVGLKLKKQ